jgi:hypothetical protein
MAVTQNTLIGRSRGSVGGVTFTKWKGLNVIKSKPEEVENPQTIPQQTQRNRLSLMVSIYRSISALIQVGFKELAINQSEYNSFVSENIQSATTVSVAPAVDLDPQNLVVAKGPLSPTVISSASATDGSADVTINFANTATAPDQALSDLAYAMCINASTQEFGQALGTDLRSDGSIVVQLPGTATAGDEIDCYLFFKEDGSDRVSDSSYLMTTAV